MDALVCSGTRQVADRAAAPSAARAGACSRPSVPGRNLRHRLPHFRGQTPFPAVSPRDGTRTGGRGRRCPGGLRRLGRRDLRRQPLPFLWMLRRVSRRKAELLRECFRARRPPGWRHGWASLRAARQSHSRRRPDRGSMCRRGISRDWCTCGETRCGDEPRAPCLSSELAQSAWALHCSRASRRIRRRVRP